MKHNFFKFFAALCFVALAIDTPAQNLILGRSTNDQFLPVFWTRNQTASNLVTGLRVNGALHNQFQVNVGVMSISNNANLGTNQTIVSRFHITGGDEPLEIESTAGEIAFRSGNIDVEAISYFRMITDVGSESVLFDVPIVLSGQTKFANGSAAAPSVGFTSDDDTGMYRSAANTLAFSAGGVQQMTIGSSTVGIANGLSVLGEIANENLIADRFVVGTGLNKQFGSSGSSAMLRNTLTDEKGSGEALFNNADTVTLTTANITFTDGSEGTPSVGFANDPDTGLYRIGANRIGIASGGTGRFEVDASGHLVPLADNSYDIGQGAQRIRNIESGGQATLNDLAVQGSSTFSGSSSFTSASFSDGLTANASIQVNGGDVTVTTGNIIVNTEGNGISIKEGSNAKMGVATLVNGTVTVNTTAVTADSRIFPAHQPTLAGTKRGILVISAKTAATSFVIRAEDIDGNLVDDDSPVAWMIVEPAP